MVNIFQEKPADYHLPADYSNGNYYVFPEEDALFVKWLFFSKWDIDRSCQNTHFIFPFFRLAVPVGKWRDCWVR